MVHCSFEKLTTREFLDIDVLNCLLPTTKRDQMGGIFKVETVSEAFRIGYYHSLTEAWFIIEMFSEVSLLSINDFLCVFYVGYENCASVWSFSFASAIEDGSDDHGGHLNIQSENENVCLTSVPVVID